MDIKGDRKMSGNNGDLDSGCRHSSYITTIALSALILLLLTFTVLPEPTLAHPPADMELEYDFDEQTLFVSITHSVPNPESHYVKKIEIKKNGDLYLTEEYTNQPTTSAFTYNYDVHAVDGDVLEATAYCNLYGSITEQIAVPTSSPSPTPKPLPAPTVTPTPSITPTPTPIPPTPMPQIPGVEAIFAIAGILAVAYILRKRE